MEIIHQIVLDSFELVKLDKYAILFMSRFYSKWEKIYWFTKSMEKLRTLSLQQEMSVILNFF